MNYKLLFKTKEMHKVTWKHPRSGHWHQLDFIITRRQHLNHTSLTRSYHSADCDTDHSLVVARVRLRPKRIYTAKHKSSLRINIINTKDPDKCFDFQQQLEDVLTDTSENCTASEMAGILKENIKQRQGVYFTVDYNRQD